MSSKAADRRLRAGVPRLSREPRAGFTLVEVLVALLVAAVMAGTVGRAFSTAWSATMRPRDTLASLSLSRALADEPAGSGRRGGFAFVSRSRSLEFVARPSPAAPPPATQTAAKKPPSASSANAGNMAILRGLTPLRTPPPRADAAASSPILAGLTPPGAPQAGGPDVGGPPLRLRLVEVEVEAPSGRRSSWMSIRRDVPAR